MAKTDYKRSELNTLASPPIEWMIVSGLTIRKVREKQ